MNSVQGDWELPQPSFLIRTSPDQRSFASFPELIAGYHVLLRFSMPRHPPYTLKSLATFTDHRQRNPSPRLVRAEIRAASRRACGDGCSSYRHCSDGNGPTSPKRCPTTPARQKDHCFGWGIPPSQGRASRRIIRSSPDEPSVEPQDHSLVKERLSLYYDSFWPRFSR